LYWWQFTIRASGITSNLGILGEESAKK